MLPALFWGFTAVNAVTFLVWGWDKWRARAGGRRVPEAWLLLLTLATGFVGAWVGVSVFRHKTQKTSFRIKLVAVTALSLALMGMAWYLSGSRAP